MTTRKQPAQRKRATKKTSGLVKQEHGGAIYQGAPANPVAGPGRPKDEIREKLLGLANGKGIDFLEQLMKGEVDVAFYTTCPKCKHRNELPDDDEYLDKILDRVGQQVSASVDHRLRGSEQALKYGLGTKDEIDVMHPMFQAEAKRYHAAVESALRNNVSEQVAMRILDEVRVMLGGAQ